MVDMWCQHRRASTRRLAAVSAGLHKPVRSPAAAASSSYAAVLHEHRRLQQRTPAASRGRAGEEGRIAAGLRMRVDGTSFTCAPRTAAELAQGIALSSAHETPSAGTEAAVCFAVVGGAWATPPPAHTHHASPRVYHLALWATVDHIRSAAHDWRSAIVLLADDADFGTGTEQTDAWVTHTTRPEARASQPVGYVQVVILPLTRLSFCCTTLSL